MKNTVQAMLESEFGCSLNILSDNKQILNNMDMISESVRQLTGYTPEKVAVLNDGNNIYIEFANNLERLMEDGGYYFNEALSMVLECNFIAGCQPYIIIDESAVDRINLNAIIAEVGAEHVLRK